MFKGICIALFLSLSANVCIAQEQRDEPKTAIDSFVAENSGIIVKEYYKIGKFGSWSKASLEIEAVFFYPAGLKDNGIKGLRMGGDYGGELPSKSSHVDIDEIPDLIDAISALEILAEEILADEIGKTSTAEYTEAYYDTKGSFRVGIVKENGGKLFNEWRAFADCGLLRRTLKLKELTELKEYISEGLAKLNTL
jgi:hypothetical protein